MKHTDNEKGFGMLELLATLAFVGILSGLALYNLRESVNPLAQGVNGFSSYLRQVKSQAISTTSAYRVRPASNGRAFAEFAASCNSTDFQNDTTQFYELPVGAVFTTLTWNVCFSSRGLPDGNVVVGLEGDGEATAVEIFLGGAIREVEQ